MKCHLCRNDFLPTEESHIFPAFVFRWLKKTSATGFIRHSECINRRKQDGIKCHFLCGDCEDLLAESETAFSRNIFHPFDKDCHYQTEYGGFFLHFAVSCVWRVLEHSTQLGHPTYFRGRHTVALESAKENWRKFLLGEEDLSDQHSIHCLPIPGIVASDMDLPDKINRYFTRLVGGDIACSDSEAFVYCKLGPFAFFGLITYPDPTHWVGTRIEKEGTFGPRNTVVPSQFGKYMNNRAAKFNVLEEQISEKQFNKIYKSYEKDLDRVAMSGTFRAMLLEEELKKAQQADGSQR